MAANAQRPLTEIEVFSSVMKEMSMDARWQQTDHAEPLFLKLN